MDLKNKKNLKKIVIFLSEPIWKEIKKKGIDRGLKAYEIGDILLMEGLKTWDSKK